MSIAYPPSNRPLISGERSASTPRFSILPIVDHCEQLPFNIKLASGSNQEIESTVPAITLELYKLRNFIANIDASWLMYLNNQQDAELVKTIVSQFASIAITTRSTRDRYKTELSKDASLSQSQDFANYINVLERTYLRTAIIAYTLGDSDIKSQMFFLLKWDLQHNTNQADPIKDIRDAVHSWSISFGKAGLYSDRSYQSYKEFLIDLELACNEDPALLKLIKPVLSTIQELVQADHGWLSQKNVLQSQSNCHEECWSESLKPPAQVTSGSSNSIIKNAFLDFYDQLTKFIAKVA